jgi:magnesium-transporting ATPase (P-type)
MKHQPTPAEPKPESHAAITHLRRARVRPVMITGDNAQCGQYVSRACELIDAEAHILLAEAVAGTGAGEKEIVWSFMGGEGASFGASSHHLAASSHRARSQHGGNASGGGGGGLPPSLAGRGAGKSTEEVLGLAREGRLTAADGQPIELAVTGSECLRALRQGGQLEALLPDLRVFARMSPEDKTLIVRMLRAAGYTVGMCGDGEWLGGCSAVQCSAALPAYLMHDVCCMLYAVCLPMAYGLWPMALACL